MTPSCKGCRFLVSFPLHGDIESRCKALEVYQYVERIQPDGAAYRRVELVSGEHFRETITKRRAPDGKCGPEARLRESNWRERLWKWVTRASHE